MTEDRKHQLDELSVTDILSYLGARASDMEEQIRRSEKQSTIAELRNRNQELLKSCEGATMMYKELQKAKKLIKIMKHQLFDVWGYIDNSLEKKVNDFLKG